MPPISKPSTHALPITAGPVRNVRAVHAVACPLAGLHTVLIVHAAVVWRVAIIADYSAVVSAVPERGAAISSAAAVRVSLAVARQAGIGARLTALAYAGTSASTLPIGETSVVRADHGSKAVAATVCSGSAILVPPATAPRRKADLFFARFYTHCAAVSALGHHAVRVRGANLRVIRRGRVLVPGHRPLSPRSLRITRTEAAPWATY
jgi:hypothetical protein